MRSRSLWAMTQADPRTLRRSLRAEKAQLIRWRRLLRARLDLTVAAYAPPSPLGDVTWDLLPDAQSALPLPHELAAAITLAVPSDPVAHMEHLRSLDRRLAVYGAELDTALESSTYQIVDELASPPIRLESPEAAR